MPQPTTEPTMTQQQLLELVLHSARGVTIGAINSMVRGAQTGQSLGPLVNPTQWTREASRQHDYNLNILQRFRDLRYALAEADEYLEELQKQKQAP